jgi:hypothetical protein
VAASTDLIFPVLGAADGTSGVRGRVEPARVRAAILVERASDGAPVTQITTAVEGPQAGRYSAVLPPGDYRLTLRAAQRPPLRVPVTVLPGAFAESPTQRFEEPGALRFGSAFADGGPGRVIVAGLEGTPDPVFGDELLDFRIDGKRVHSATEIRELFFLGGGRDPERVLVPPGSYRLTATRGPEFDVAQLDVVVKGPGAEVEVAPFALRRVVDLPGFTSADLHVHAEGSDDSGMSNAARLRSFAAEAVDVMVSSEHDNIGHFGPALDALGLGERIRVIQGVEVTSSAPSQAAPWSIGHHNAWPIPYRPLEHRNGAPPSQGGTVADLYASLRHEYGARVVQLNHPLARQPGVDESHYLTHLGSAGEAYDPRRPLDAAPNRLLLEPSSDGSTRALDFDAIELMNGRSFDQYRRVREVWYSLLRQGVRRTATGNSDSHGPWQRVAYPRNYVATGADDASAFHAAIREGRLFATTGPLLTAFRANGAGMGDLVAAPDGRVEVQLAVSAAPWVPVDEVRLLVNGEPAHTWRELAEPEKVMRLLRSVELLLEHDAFLTLEAGAPLDVDPARWGAERGGVYASRVAPGFVSQALANPIYVDVDGNGRFDPPGLPTTPASRRLLATSLILTLLAFTWWRLRARSGVAARR